MHACLSICLPTRLPACLPAYLTVSHSKCVHACLVPVCVCVCVPVCLFAYMFAYLGAYFFFPTLYTLFLYISYVNLLNEFFFLFTSQITQLVLHQTQIVRLFGDINYREFKARYLENDEHFIYFRHSRLVT